MPTSTAGNSINRARNGYTLFELVVVIAVLACVAGLVVPQLNLNFGGEGVEGAVRCVEQAMDQARARARLTRTPVTIRFDAHAITLSPGDEVFACPGDTEIKRLNAATGEQLSTPEIIAAPTGVVAPVVVVVSVDEQVYTLCIRPVLRRIDTQKGVANYKDFIG